MTLEGDYRYISKAELERLGGPVDRDEPRPSKSEGRQGRGHIDQGPVFTQNTKLVVSIWVDYGATAVSVPLQAERAGGVARGVLPRRRARGGAAATTVSGGGGRRG